MMLARWQIVSMALAVALLAAIVFAPSEDAPGVPRRSSASSGRPASPALLPIDGVVQGPVSPPPARPAADRAYPALLRSPSAAVRRTAIAQLAASGTEEAARALLEQFARETDPETLLALAVAVKRASVAHPGDSAARALAARFASTTDPAVRGAILAAFAVYPAVGDRSHVAGLAAQASSGEETRKITECLARFASMSPSGERQ